MEIFKISFKGTQCGFVERSVENQVFLTLELKELYFGDFIDPLMWRMK